jgi:hypothetical protein
VIASFSIRCGISQEHLTIQIPDFYGSGCAKHSLIQVERSPDLLALPADARPGLEVSLQRLLQNGFIQREIPTSFLSRAFSFSSC